MKLTKQTVEESVPIEKLLSDITKYNFTAVLLKDCNQIYVVVPKGLEEHFRAFLKNTGWMIIDSETTDTSHLFWLDKGDEPPLFGNTAEIPKNAFEATLVGFSSIVTKRNPADAMTDFLYSLVDVLGTASGASILQRALVKAATRIIMTGGQRPILR